VKEEAEDIVFPVPDKLSAVYLVPSRLSWPEARERVLGALPSVITGPGGEAVEKMLRLGTVTVGTLPASVLPPMLAELQEHLGVDGGLVDAVTSTETFAGFITEWAPGWPPVHEITGRACATALTTATWVSATLMPSRHGSLCQAR
jgi:hypothetical protein